MSPFSQKPAPQSMWGFDSLMLFSTTTCTPLIPFLVVSQLKGHSTIVTWMSKSSGQSQSNGFGAECGLKEIWWLDKCFQWKKWSSTEVEEGDINNCKKKKQKARFSFFSGQPSEEWKKSHKCQILHFHLINCLQGCGTGGRRARAQRSAAARERVESPRGEESQGPSIDLFLLNLEQKNGRWNEIKWLEKSGSHLLTSPLPSHISLTWFMTFPCVGVRCGGERGCRDVSLSRWEIDAVSGIIGVWYKWQSGEMANVSSTYFHHCDIIVFSSRLNLATNASVSVFAHLATLRLPAKNLIFKHNVLNRSKPPSGSGFEWLPMMTFYPRQDPMSH